MKPLKLAAPGMTATIVGHKAPAAEEIAALFPQNAPGTLPRLAILHSGGTLLTIFEVPAELLRGLAAAIDRNLPPPEPADPDATRH